VGAPRSRALILQFRSRRYLELERTQAGLVILDGNRRCGSRHCVSLRLWRQKEALPRPFADVFQRRRLAPFRIPPRKAARGGISSSATSKTTTCFFSTTIQSSIESFPSASSETGNKNFARSSKPSFLVSITANHFPRAKLYHPTNRAPRPNVHVLRRSHDDASHRCGRLRISVA
jgi:hypothetical protein